MKPELAAVWPDAALVQDFRTLLSIYRGLVKNAAGGGGSSKESLARAFRALCREIQRGSNQHRTPSNANLRIEKGDRKKVVDIKRGLRGRYGNQWLQALASLLGMLLHFTPDDRHKSILVNKRRPSRHFSSYPNSPAVTQLVCDRILESLRSQARRQRRRIRSSRRSSDAADSAGFIKDLANCRIIDLSMESGQLILGIAMGMERMVQRAFRRSPSKANRVFKALLRKTCRDCLWGVDKNELSVAAVNTVFGLLGRQYGMTDLSLKNLRVGDSLRDLSRPGGKRFDAVVNNPPWGDDLGVIERSALRRTFETMFQRSNTYVAFFELAVKLLKPSGVFELIVPSQMAATRNAFKLRKFLLSNTVLREMVLLPRQAFAHASVRGLVLSGQKGLPKPGHVCRVTVHPFAVRAGRPKGIVSFQVPVTILKQSCGRSWWPIMNRAGGWEPRQPTVELEKVASIQHGILPYGLGCGSPPQTAEVLRRRAFSSRRRARGFTPAVRGRNMADFDVGEPEEFIRLGKWLARTGGHAESRLSPRVFLRELCRDDGKLSAAVAPDGVVPIYGVFCVLPKRIDPLVLVALLNSTVLARYVCRYCGAMSKVRFQKITIREARRLPIPIRALNATQRRALGLPPATSREKVLRRKLASLVRKVLKTGPRNEREKKMLLSQIDWGVSSMFEFNGASGA